MPVLETPGALPLSADRCSGARCETGVSLDTTEDLAFAARLVARETLAWREFLQRYERLIYSRVLSAAAELGREPQPEIIEDCCGDVVAELFRDDLVALRGYRGRSKLSTWLAVVARRTALGSLTRRFRETDLHRQPDSGFDLQTVPEPSRSTGLSCEIDCPELLLDQGLARLSPVDRKVLQLHFQDRQGYAAIAQELGISANAVGPKLHRAQQRLRKWVEQIQRSGGDEAKGPQT